MIDEKDRIRRREVADAMIVAAALVLSKLSSVEIANFLGLLDTGEDMRQTALWPTVNGLFQRQSVTDQGNIPAMSADMMSAVRCACQILLQEHLAKTAEAGGSSDSREDTNYLSVKYLWRGGELVKRPRL